MKLFSLAFVALAAFVTPVTAHGGKRWEESRPIVQAWYQKYQAGELTNSDIWRQVAEGEVLMMPDIKNHPEIKELIKLDKSMPIPEARRKMFLKLAELDVAPLWPPVIVNGGDL